MADTPGGLTHLKNTMAALRGPGGCPWDSEQTHESLAPYLQEEVFELIEAIESGTQEDLVEELGDVLYQIFFHADLVASDTDGGLDIDDVAHAVAEKMRRRHPHVFAQERTTATVDEVVARWDVIKAEEKKHRTSALEGIPNKLSALARAHSVLKRSAALVPPPPHAAAATTPEELGEVLLGIVAQARQQGFDAETALRHATRRFENRVREAETAAGLAPGVSDA